MCWLFFRVFTNYCIEFFFICLDVTCWIFWCFPSLEVKNVELSFLQWLLFLLLYSLNFCLRSYLIFIFCSNILFFMDIYIFFFNTHLMKWLFWCFPQVIWRSLNTSSYIIVTLSIFILFCCWLIHIYRFCLHFTMKL